MVTFPGSSTSETAGGGTANPCDDLTTIQLQVQDRDRVIVVRVRGEVDMVTTPRLHSCLQEQLAMTPRRLVVDLSEVSFLGSSGLAVLVECLDEARMRGTDLRLVANSREVLRPLTATGLTDLFPTYPDVKSAHPG
ncbi:MAG: STAS domain-containing protein [Actinomycetota bacterium]|nr:STAS domain-containing protein [Actinomycetota bacterium]